jgi:organic hydroperoxide reductase OsmC/OhrA
LRITTIRLRYNAKVPSEKREEAERALAVYADKCPAYQSVRGCIDVTWEAELEEE